MRSHGRIICQWILQFISVSLVVTTTLASQQPKNMKIGGLFEQEDSQQKTAFYRAISMINTDNNVIFGVHLVPRVENVAPQDSFRALKKSCSFLQEGVAAIFAPKSPSNAAVLRSFATTFQIPVIQTNWVPRSASESNVTINLFPDTKLLASAFVEFLKEHNWKSFTFIYEDNEDLIRLQDLLQMPTVFKDSQVKIFLRQAREGIDLNKMMKDLNKLGQTNFVMDLPLDRIKEVFAAGEKVDMMTEYNNYLITTLDVHTVEWTENYIGRPNITAFRLIDPENEVFKRILKDWIYAEQILGNEVIGKQPITTEAALMYDAFSLFSSSLHSMRLANSNVQVMSLDCDSSNVWGDGLSVAQHIKFKPFEGASGLVKIDLAGGRTSFSLDLVKVTKRGIIKVATWDTENGFTYKKEVNPLNEAKELLKNATLRVTTVITKPYMMEVEDKSATGNDRFEGFCKDLLDKLTEALGFRYVIEKVKDTKHGTFKNGEWNGMIGELLRREADLAIGDLSITFQREGAVDFTMPFMNLGISILFKKPEKQTPPMFSFLKPLSLEVWFYMGTAYLGVSLFLFILARLSPYEWVNPHPCEADNDVVENQFTLLNSFWFTIGSIMQQGSDILPRAISTRIVASSWWFFTLIMISSYTANLAAFLTAQRMSSPIESAADLAKQTSILYGSVKGGSTMNFFKDSNYPIYKRMWSFMESQRPSVFPSSNAQGIERVKMGNYAFLMESTSIEYVTERNCELTRIGGELDSKGYGIATPPGSPYRGLLSSGILDLQEKQQLQILKDKWWKAADRCPDDSGSSSAEMGIRNVGGVFLVLGIGSLLGIVIVVLEFIWKANKMLDRGSIAAMLWHELRSTLSCRGSTRPAPKDPDEPSVEKMPMVNLSKMEDYKFS